MNAELKKAKEAIRKIERFCKSRPMPTPTQVSKFVESENIEEYDKYAQEFINSQWTAEWILHTKKINKSR